MTGEEIAELDEEKIQDMPEEITEEMCDADHLDEYRVSCDNPLASADCSARL